VVMVVLFGIVALQNIPIQLAPDVNRPVISINTSWPGAAPAEVEREIINRQEEALRGLEGLAEMSSASSTGSGRITLEFNVGQDMDRALLLVANRLNRVSGYPDEADEPLLDTAGSDDQPIAWFTFRRAPGNERDINTYREFLDDVIRERIERVPGVSRVNVFGGADRELKITVDPLLMAEYGLTVPDIVLALRAANVSVSAGDVDEGKRRYVVRSEGEFKTPDDVRAVLLRSITDPATGRVARVTVGDVAEVAFGIKEATAAIRYLGEPALAMNAQRETGANVIETMAGIREAVEQLNAGLIPDAGLTLVQVYDETTYIRSSIDLVTQNIYVGGTLAALMLLLFLRSVGATLIVSVAIPVSVIGELRRHGRDGPVDQRDLAGRHRLCRRHGGRRGDRRAREHLSASARRQIRPPEAAYEGARQVWGAILVSALTTVMVFIPILTMELEVGQLFRDIAVAISVAVILSLIVAVTVIPALASRLLGRPDGERHQKSRLPVIDRLAGFRPGTSGFVRRIVGHEGSPRSRWWPAVTAPPARPPWLFLPKLEYLPEGQPQPGVRP
jgi:hydrophobic/amphiphilic exporter-1 (mainly G- bacteria), HAE1 family